MSKPKSKRTFALMTVVGVVTILMLALMPMSAMALPQFATATGQSCGVCHINPAGGGPLTATGQAFAAQANHAADPAAAFAAVMQASPSPTASPSAAALPSAGGGPGLSVIAPLAVLLAVVGLAIRRLATTR